MATVTTPPPRTSVPPPDPDDAPRAPALGMDSGPASTRRTWAWIVGILVVIALGAAAYHYGWPRAAPAATATGPAKGPDGKGFDPANRPLPVVAQPVRKGSIDVYLNALGTVTPRNLVTVKPRVDGQLMSVYFDEGQYVKAGQLLAQIDPRPFEVQLGQAQGQLAKDQALLANARVDLTRYQTLLSQDSIAKQQVDTQESLVRQYESTIQADQSAVDSAKLQLTYARVTSPIAGRAGLRQVDPGNVVHASDTTGIVVIAQLQPISVVFPIPEDNVPLVMSRLTQGLPTVVEAWNREQTAKLATGKLVTADNQIDTTTGTVKMKAEFPNDNNVLFPNQFVNVRMLTQTLNDATLVPSAAIQRGAPGTFVYVVKDDQTVTVAPVKLGPVQGETTVVTSGVRPGAIVVVDGADKLREGAKVEVITREGQQVAPARQGGQRWVRGDRPPGEGKGQGRRNGETTTPAPAESAPKAP
ncbi:MAG TPA: MdtA/MuxA family multidrug efflux RND transporter periplasmic adaptor subunit [Casimicrobiaceae bacterium]|nr:MdtA/MuxA family multidrug efflux RND transporter periplasmic adaptor subunit [Casimicrobiaceae bacterium]